MILHRTWFLSRSGLDDFTFGSFALWFCFALMFAFSLQDAREQRQQVLASLAGKVVEFWMTHQARVNWGESAREVIRSILIF